MEIKPDRDQSRIKLLETIIENMGNPVWLYDKNGTLLMANKSAAEHLG
jgi:PAS domain-containing protein